MTAGHHPLPILEFDPNPRALINADEQCAPVDIPHTIVLCFFFEVIDTLCTTGRIRQVHAVRSEMGYHPIYELSLPDGQRIGLMHPGVGAPLAAQLMEEVIAHGGRTFIAVGGAGSLQSELTVGHVVIPSKALRDEGVSYHYVAPSRWIEAQHNITQQMTAVLDERGIPYVVGPTWTTDAFYRETPAKVARRRAEGCITVEMENAAFLAVAQLRNVRFGQILYSADDVSGAVWDGRGWNSRESLREQLLFLAVDIAAQLERASH